MSNEKRAAIFIFNDVDLLDVAGPKEVLSTVRGPSGNDSNDPILRLYESDALIEVKYVGLGPEAVVRTSDGTKIVTDILLEDFVKDDFDILIVPGGKGAQVAKNNEELLDTIRMCILSGKKILSVCTGAYILAETGMFEGRKMTTHHRHFKLFQEKYPSIELKSGVKYIEDGEIIICGGVTAGLDGSLRLIEKMYGRDIAERSARSINY